MVGVFLTFLTLSPFLLGRVDGDGDGVCLSVRGGKGARTQSRRLSGMES